MSASLLAYVALHDLDPILTMNMLQEHGICSDNCITLEDVGDGGKCLAWLHNQPDLRAIRKRKGED